MGAETGSACLGTHRKRNSRPLIFLAVLMLHGTAVLVLVRATQQYHSPSRQGAEPLTFLLLHKTEPTTIAAATADAPNAKSSKRKPSQPPPEATNAITAPAETAAAPKIDWQHESELAAQNGVANADKERNYRNLGGLSAAQLKWVRDNHMVQMAPGIVWAHPRVEIDKNTLLPIVHINDHCVLVLVFVFCGIGHIQPNSHLFEHLHDTPDP
jgi:hypothetical protein